MIQIIPLIVLSIAAYRITRLLVIDTLIAGLRNKFHTIVVNKSHKENKGFHLFWDKLYELTSCTWCAGFWVTVALYWAYTWSSPIYWNRLDIINLFAIAGIQGFLHALEPDNE